MNQVSFKARITGLNNPDLETEFEKKTFQDTKHSVKILQDKDTYADVFIMYKNGKPSAKHLNLTINKKNGEYTLENLLKLFNILKIKEAETFILNSKNAKKEKDFIEEMKELDKEDEKKAKIISLIENSGKFGDNEENISETLTDIQKIKG